MKPVSGYPRKYFRTGLKRSVAAVAACFALSAAANPLNPTVVNGSAGFSQSGSTLTVTNSNGAIIHWDKFSIAAGETTRFIQASASSSVLNRVLASDPSLIYGTLSSNGQVWLVNPSGIFVGASGRIDVAGFVASTLNVTNADFLANRLNFGATTGAGTVVNQGQITTPQGGSVYLIGSSSTNEGIITTPQGETILAAGATVSLIDSATPGVKVEITGAAGNATNLGTITAEAGRIGIAGVIVRNSGTLNASSVVSDGGRVFLKASQDAYVDGAGRIVTTGTKGGSVEVLGNRVAVMDTASIDASAITDGGDGGSIKIGGDYQGKNPDIQNAQITYLGPDATLKANAGKVGAGGTVIVWADDTTRAFGRIEATGGSASGNGGFVETSGKRYLNVSGIKVSTAALDGKAGTWLLDPTDITIVHATSGGGGDFSTYGGTFWNGGGATTTLSDYDINANISAGDIVVTTNGAGGGTGDITFDASGGSIVISNGSGPRNLTITADHDIVFYGGSTTFTSVAAASPLEIGFNPGVNRKVEVQSGATVILDGTFSDSLVSAALRNASGKTWENFGTVTLAGKSYIDLNIFGASSTFNNNVGAILNLGSNHGFAIQSESVNQAEAINNAGTINVTTGTAIEAAYYQSASGTLNIANGQGLNLQNAISLTGDNSADINLNATGILNINENHGTAATLTSLTFAGTGGNLNIGNPGGSYSGKVANLTNVFAPNVTLGVGVTSYPGTVNLVNGDATFKSIGFNGGNLGSIANGTLAVTTGDFSVPAGVTYSGNVGFMANGSLSFLGGTSYVIPGTLTAVAGWDGTTPASSITGTSNFTGITGVTGSVIFYGGTSVSAAGMTLKAAGNINVGDTYTAATNVLSSGYQKVYATGNINVKAGNASYGSSTLFAAGSQTLTANSIFVTSGDGANVYGSSAKIQAYGDQILSVGTQAAGGISIISSGPTNTGGYNNQASIEHGSWNGGSFSGNQTINLGVAYASTLSITGGDGNGTGGYTDSECQTNCAGANNSAQLHNHFGNLTINTPTAGSTITLTGGGGGNNNYASIDNESSGTLRVGSFGTAPTITLTGGASGGSVGTEFAVYGGGVHYNSNDAGISSETSTTVYGSALTLVGGSASYGGAYVGGSTVNVHTTGNLLLTGGSGNSGLATTLSTPAAIGNDANTSVTLNVGGNLTLNGGLGYGAYSMVGSIEGNATVVANVQGGISFTGTAAFSDRMGSLTSATAGSVTLNSGLGGTGTMALGNGLIDTWTAQLTAAGTGGVTQSSLGRIDAYQLTANSSTAGAITLIGTNLVNYVSLTAPDDITYNSYSSFHLTSATSVSGAITASTTASTPYGGNAYINYVSTSGNVGIFAYGGSASIGSITTSGNAEIFAYNGIYDSNGSAVTNVAADTITLTSYGGGLSGELAISLDTQATTAVLATAAATGTHGGIRIWNYSTEPTFQISSTATNSNNIDVYNATDLTIAGIGGPPADSFAVSSGGSIYVESGGNLIYLSGNASTFDVGPGPTDGVVSLAAAGNLTISASLVTPSSIELSAGGTLNIANSVSSSLGDVAASGTTVILGGALFAYGSAALAATGTLDLNSAVTVQNGDILVAGGTVYVDGDLSASNTSSIILAGNSINMTKSASAGDIGVIAGSLTAFGTGAFLQASSGDIAGAFIGDVRLNDGAHFNAPLGDVDLVFTGSGSTLYLNDVAGLYANASYINASPNTIHLNFTSRSDGGIVIDGVEGTTTVVGGSGFFTGGLSSPALAGTTLMITRAVPSKVDPVSTNLEAALSSVDPSETPVESIVLIQAGEIEGGSQTSGFTSGNTADSFGGESASTGSATNADNEPAKDGKNDKDDKDKKSESGDKTDKKDDKPAQKKVAQCT